MIVNGECERTSTFCFQLKQEVPVKLHERGKCGKLDKIVRIGKHTGKVGLNEYELDSSGILIGPVAGSCK